MGGCFSILLKVINKTTAGVGGRVCVGRNVKNMDTNPNKRPKLMSIISIVIHTAI